MKKPKFFIASFCFILSSLFTANGQWSRVAPNTYLTTSSDMVGIGTSIPKFNLHVKGLNPNSDMMTLGSTTTGNFALTSQDGNAYGLFAGVSGTGRAWLQVGRYDSNTAYDLTLQAAGGNVGIGTLVPTNILDVSAINGQGIRIGKLGDAGNFTVPLNSLSSQLNIDFTGFRDNTPDQIGARISALRFNCYQSNVSAVQKTGLAFYTNPFGVNSGTTDLSERMRITPEGFIGIGTNAPMNLLDVKGTIHAQQVLVDMNNWSDFVFDKKYTLISLKEVNTFIEVNGHLPNIPSEGEIREKGVNVTDMQAKLLQKIEELTLYVIDQDKIIEKLQKQIDNK